MSREKQSFDIADKLNFEKQRRGEYARRIVEAVRYEGADDHEDVHSILCDYRDEIIAGYRKQSEVIANNATTIGEWISVYERLPEAYEDVLYFNGQSVGVDFICSDGTWCDEEVHGKPITHWMPLPEVPKMKGGAEWQK